MRKLFLIGFLFLINSLGFAQNQDGTAEIVIQPPSLITHEIYCYCLEYCKHPDECQPDAEWEYISVIPEMRYNPLNGQQEYAETTYTLTDLEPNTVYAVRVHAFYFEYNEYGEYYNFGKYGGIFYCTASEYGGGGPVVVICGPMPIDDGDWHSMYVITSLTQELPERVLYRSKEEWEQFC